MSLIIIVIIIFCYCSEDLRSSAAMLLMWTFISVQKKQLSESRECVDWLLQLMGFIKNFVTDRESTSDDTVPEVRH